MTEYVLLAIEAVALLSMVYYTYTAGKHKGFIVGLICGIDAAKNDEVEVRSINTAVMDKLNNLIGEEGDEQ